MDCFIEVELRKDRGKGGAAERSERSTRCNSSETRGVSPSQTRPLNVMLIHSGGSPSLDGSAAGSFVALIRILEVRVANANKELLLFSYANTFFSAPANSCARTPKDGHKFDYKYCCVLLL